MNFFLGPFLIWLPKLFFLGVFVCAVWRYCVVRGYVHVRMREWGTIKQLWMSVLWFRGGYATLLTIAQYYIWSQNDFTRAFLNTSLGEDFPVPWVRNFPFLFDTQFGYFFLYVWQRFWLEALVTFCVAWIFFLFLKLLKKYRARFFYDD